MVTLGFIGTGNMGGAIARALRTATGEILITDRSGKARKLAEELDIRYGTAQEVASDCDRIFVAVKPHMVPEVLEPLQESLQERKPLIISMAAGLTIPRIRELAGKDYPVIRIMPNTPSAIGEGMVFYDCSENITKPEEKIFLESLAGAGRLAPLADRLMDAGSAVAGCGPAFADLFLEALADGGVACGLPRALALESAAQMMIGTAKLMLETGNHPGQLKDEVCSPGGATIQGIRALEEAGFRGAVMDAVIAAWEKSTELK